MPKSGHSRALPVRRLECPGSICSPLRRMVFSLNAAIIAARHRHALTSNGAVMNTLIGILITFLVIILVLYLINMLPIAGRAKQIVRIVVIIIGVLSLLKYLAIY